MSDKKYESKFELIKNYAGDKVDDIEVVMNMDQTFSTKVHKQKTESFDYSNSKGLGLRIKKDGKVGYSYTENFDDEVIKGMIDEAVANSKILNSDDEEYVEKFDHEDKDLKIFNPELSNIPIEKKIATLKNLEDIIYKMDKRVINVPYCGYSDGSSSFRIFNSKGMDKNYSSNSIVMYAGALAEENGEKRSAMDFIITRDFANIDPEKIAEKAVKKTIDLLNSKPLEKGQYPVVFNNSAASSLLGTFIGIFSSREVQEGRSLLKGKMNQQIAGTKVTLIDDGLYENGISSRPFDGEGYPSQTTVLMEDGKLTNLLYNTITARKDGVQSTGNASRFYKGEIGVGTTNIILKPGNDDRNVLLGSSNKVIEIVSLQGLHSGANPISGDFSLSAEGFLYENGIRQHSLKSFIVSGNFFDVLKNIEGFANDFEFSMSSIGTASILVSGLSVSG